MGEHVGQIAIISRLNVTVFNVLLQVLLWENMLGRLQSLVDSMLQCSMRLSRNAATQMKSVKWPL